MCGSFYELEKIWDFSKSSGELAATCWTARLLKQKGGKLGTTRGSTQPAAPFFSFPCVEHSSQQPPFFSFPCTWKPAAVPSFLLHVAAAAHSLLFLFFTWLPPFTPSPSFLLLLFFFSSFSPAASLTHISAAVRDFQQA
jgi:hypothetical protein